MANIRKLSNIKIKIQYYKHTNRAVFSIESKKFIFCERISAPPGKNNQAVIITL